MSGSDQSGAAIALRGPARSLLAANAALDLALAEVVIATLPANSGEAERLAEARAAADRHDLAFIVEDDPTLAEALSADGVEVEWSPEAYAEARRVMGPERTVGCRVGLLRHDAMLAAEAGADYVALGVPIDSDDDFDQIVDMTAWWADIFEVTCLVIGARSLGDAARFAAAGADFVDAPPDLWGAAPQLVVTAFRPRANGRQP